MPITKNCSIYYSIPQKIKKYIDFNFCQTLLQELHLIWGFSLEDFNWDSVGFCEGTGGWNEAIVSTCRKLKSIELLKYYYSLDWYDSDLFDSELAEMLSTYKLILPKMDVDEYSRQLSIEEDKIGLCGKCNLIFNKKDMILLEENDEDFYEFESNYICNKCYGKENAYPIPLKIDIEVAIQEVLGLEKTDYFKCEQCGKIHYNYNRKQNTNICKYCDIQNISDNEHANLYYKILCSENEKFLRVHIPKHCEYRGAEIEFIYNEKKEKFEGIYKNKKISATTLRAARDEFENYIDLISKEDIKNDNN